MYTVTVAAPKPTVSVTRGHNLKLQIAGTDSGNVSNGALFINAPSGWTTIGTSQGI